MRLDDQPINFKIIFRRLGFSRTNEFREQEAFYLGAALSGNRGLD